MLLLAVIVKELLGSYSRNLILARAKNFSTQTRACLPFGDIGIEVTSAEKTPATSLASATCGRRISDMRVGKLRVVRLVLSAIR